MPAGVLRFVGVKEPGATDDIPYSDCKVGRQSDQTVIYTDVKTATGVYITEVSNTLLYTPELITALEYMMAAKFAGPIIKGTEGINVARSMNEMGAYYLNEAKRLDALQSKSSDVTSPSTYRAGQLRARGVSSITPDAEITRS
jgi:hypothetical protein